MAEKLVEACAAAAAAGADFPAVWHSILRSHPDVIGVPVQRMDGLGAILEIPLLSGERIVVGPGSKVYRLASGRSGPP